MSEEREHQIVNRARNGDQEAFSILVERYASRLFAVCYHLLGNRQDAEDCVQDTFIKVFRSISEYNFRSSFYTWAYRISVNTCLDFRRKNNKNRTLSIDEGLETESGQMFLQIPDASPLPDARLESAEQAALIREELAALPKYLCEIIILRDLEGLSYSELSDVLGLSEGTVKSRLSRGRKQLMLNISKREQKQSSARLKDEKPMPLRKGGAD